MQKQKTFKIIAIFSYLLIILLGEMIGLPFFVWLMVTLFDFGNLDQVFAFFAVVGLTITFIKMSAVRTLKLLLLDILCFGLLASPIARRMTDAPIEKFNYLAFIIPASLFVLFYFASLVFACKQFLGNRNAAHRVESTSE